MQGWIQYHIGIHLGMSHRDALNFNTRLFPYVYY
jgi:hypothetical protein